MAALAGVRVGLTLNEIGRCEAANADMEKANVLNRFDCAAGTKQEW